MRTIRILDGCCSAGGCAVGYYRAFTEAGFDVQITGVDIAPQPRFPFRFVQDDLLAHLGAHGWEYDFIHASPPCQNYTWAAKKWINLGTHEYPDLLAHTRFMLRSLDKPYIIENVEGAPLLNPLTLCGTQFGLRVFRHRKFESNLFLWGPGGRCNHKGLSVGFDADSMVSVAGHGGDGTGRFVDWCEAMGIRWMTKQELTQAIPPAYTHFLGKQVVAHFVGQTATVIEPTFSFVQQLTEAA